ncbi:MAG TPA: bifunctional 4-hydroxy-2-oxoglutarate aldolase/2-dehydro-3-deoxy-phosphogluconate aldolase [Pseudonocardia sp.]|nr:bifunctional 4-hydroxy-2-oxoglutarate aldolase/2-dehydro-3-deoxy-phosphogluconate aldolase [Pseudonocardia sp.]
MTGHSPQASTTEDGSLLSRCPVVPVVVLDHPDQAVPLGEALLAGGIDVVEITLRTDAGLEAIRRLAGLAGLLVGAGSVLVPGQVDQVVDAGARFVVSPGLSVDVVEHCRTRDVPALPGVATASELMTGVSLGLDEVKFFPAGLLGGPAAIRALAAPFTRMAFMPSGGVKAENMADYLAVPAVSGSWMVDPALLRAGDWAEVTARSADAVARATGA